MTTPKESVLELLQSQKDDQSQNTEERKNEWIGAVKYLMEELRHWLADAEHQGLISVEDVSQPVREKLLGEYEACALKLETPTGIVVYVRPKALHVVGANGRVDMESPPMTARLLRDDQGKWRFANLTPGGGWEFVELSEEAFWATLHGLIS